MACSTPFRPLLRLTHSRPAALFGALNPVGPLPFPPPNNRRELSTRAKESSDAGGRRSGGRAGMLAGLAAVVGGAVFYAGSQRNAAVAFSEPGRQPLPSSSLTPSSEEEEEEQAEEDYLAIPDRPDLPVYTSDEIAEHKTLEKRAWVTYRDGVFDVTDFAESHPGGSLILQAAGGPVEPFWEQYTIHKEPETFSFVREILDDLRIGTMDPKDFAVKLKKLREAADQYSHEPPRNRELRVQSDRPFNAETPPSRLVESFLTPSEYFYVRHHLPVPKIDMKTYRLHVEGPGVKNPVELKVEELKRKFRPVSVTSVMQCAGNRRAEFNHFKTVLGTPWNGGAISNAVWSGVRLKDVLEAAGVDLGSPEAKHVVFYGLDEDLIGNHYSTSVPLEKAIQDETILAFEMNGQALPLDHGYPIRAIVPGVVGARQVKWLSRIRVSSEESETIWQRKDYRVFDAETCAMTVDFDSAPSIQEGPVTSHICLPEPDTLLKKGSKSVRVEGYAWSGGGRGIVRVEVSADGGETWQMAELRQAPEQTLDRMFAWTLWSANVPVPKHISTSGGKLELVVRAVDRAYNLQPSSPEMIWNYRGLLNNAWHRVEIVVDS